jgi:hypothetical protein
VRDRQAGFGHARVEFRLVVHQGGRGEIDGGGVKSGQGGAADEAPTLIARERAVEHPVVEIFMRRDTAGPLAKRNHVLLQRFGRITGGHSGGDVAIEIDRRRFIQGRDLPYGPGGVQACGQSCVG